MKKPNTKGLPADVQNYIEYLEVELRQFTESPLVNSYLANLKTINRWNQQLIDQEINILAATDKPKFEMAHRYLTENRPYIEHLEYLRSLMTPQARKELEDKIKENNLGIAEKMAIRAQNGKG